MNRFKFFKIFCFVLSIAAALYYPVQKIIGYEFKTSHVFDFKVTGYDPYDPARGRFIALTVHPRKTEKGNDIGGQYAELAVGKDGLAVVTSIVDKPGKEPCVRLKRRYYGNILYNFDRYYINADLAPEADKIFKDAVAKNKLCALRVKVYPDGASAVSELLIDGVDIRELAKESLKKNCTTQK